MRLQQLEYFKVVAKELHFTRAAELLQMSQPPLSQQIKKLEEELGVLLFKRTQRHVELTEAGSFFLEKTTKLLNDLEFYCEEARLIHRGEQGDITLGFTGPPTYHIIPKVVQTAKKIYPNLQITLKELTTTEQVRALEEGRIHIGLLIPPINSDSLNIKPLKEEFFNIILPIKHHLNKHNTPVDLRDLSDESFLMPYREDGPGYYDAMIKQCHKAGFSPNIILQAKQFMTFISLVSSEVGVTFLPANIKFIDRDEVAVLPIKNSSSTWSTAVAWSKGNKSPKLSVILNLIMKSIK